MIKNRIALFLALILLAISVPVGFSAADNFNMSSINEEFVIVVNADNPSQSICGMEKNPDAMCYPASTTKILTCIIALERCSMDEMLTASANAVNFSIQNSLMGLMEGEQCTIEDALYGLMLVSGNDAAVAIAEHISGTCEEFAVVMNAKAAELGMSSTHFVTPNGRHDDNHYTTARDMAVLTAYALKNPAFCQIVGATHYTTKQTNMSGPREMTNSNRLLVDMVSDEFEPASCLYPDAIGVKTGDTNKAGKCLIAAAKRDGVTLIAVLLNGQQTNGSMTPAEKDVRNVRRFNDAISLFDYAFNSMMQTVSMGDLISMGLKTTFEVQANNYSQTDPNQGRYTASVHLDNAQTVSLMESAMQQLKQSIAELPVVTIDKIAAPIKAGDIIGKVTYTFDGRALFEADLIADVDVAEGVLATNTEPAISSQPVSGDIVAATQAPQSGLMVNDNPEPVEQKDNSWIIYVIIAVVAIIVLVLVIVLIRVINEQKRRKARARRQQQLRRKQHEQQMQQRRREYEANRSTAPTQRTANQGSSRTDNRGSDYANRRPMNTQRVAQTERPRPVQKRNPYTRD